MTKIIKRVTVGKRTSSGTEFPIEYILERSCIGRKRPQWNVLLSLCNGVAEGTIPFRTRREALRYLNVWAR